MLCLWYSRRSVVHCKRNICESTIARARHIRTAHRVCVKQACTKGKKPSTLSFFFVKVSAASVLEFYLSATFCIITVLHNTCSQNYMQRFFLF